MMRLDLHTARPSAPRRPAPAGVAAGGRARTSAAERRADQAWGRHMAAHQNSMGAAPPMTPPGPLPTREGQREGSGLRGPPEERSTGHPSSPPPPGAALRPRPNAHAGGECTDDKRGAKVGNRWPPPKGGAGRPWRNPSPPHTPPTRPQAAGAPACTLPRQRRWSPLPPPERGAGARPAPPAPAAGSHRNRGEQASPRQHARTPHGPRPEEAGEHEPERHGGHAPHDKNDTSDTRFVACPGKAEGRKEAEQPPTLLAPLVAQTGGAAHGPPPPTPTPPPGTGTPWTRPTRGAQPQAT